jgi:hypothetical protein
LDAPVTMATLPASFCLFVLICLFFLGLFLFGYYLLLKK